MFYYKSAAGSVFAYETEAERAQWGASDLVLMTPEEIEAHLNREPVAPLSITLTKRQVNAALILAGHADPDAFIEAAIGAIEDETQKALALNDWRNAPYYKRDHALFNDADVLTAAGLTSQSVDALWAVAAQQDR